MTDQEMMEKYTEAKHTLEEQPELRRLLDWLMGEVEEGEEHPYRICVRDPIFSARCPNSIGDVWEPISAEYNGEKIFAAFFGIDLDAVERERQRILATLPLR